MKKTIYLVTLISILSFSGCHKESYTPPNNTPQSVLSNNDNAIPSSTVPVTDEKISFSDNNSDTAIVKIADQSPENNSQTNQQEQSKLHTKPPADCLYKVGDSNSSIKTIQSQLKYLGYTISVDGSYGKGTDSALSKYCKSKKINYPGYLTQNIVSSINGAYNTYKKEKEKEIAKEKEKEPASSNPSKPVPSTSINYTSELSKYLSNTANGQAVVTRAIQLHYGDPKNTCVYTASEALRRVGCDIPITTAATPSLVSELKKRGFKTSFKMNEVMPGAICFTTDVFGKIGEHPTHTYIFMGWKSEGVANIFDNQIPDYGNPYHARPIALSYLNNEKDKVKEATVFFMYK